MKTDMIGMKLASCVSSSKARVRSFLNSASKNLASDNKAQGILEYGIIIVLVVIGAMGAISYFSNTVNTQLNKAAEKIPQAK